MVLVWTGIPDQEHTGCANILLSWYISFWPCSFLGKMHSDLESSGTWGVVTLWSFKTSFEHTAFIWKKEIFLDSSFTKLSLMFHSFSSKAVPLPVLGEAQWRPREGQPVQQCPAHPALVRLKPFPQACQDTLFFNDYCCCRGMAPLNHSPHACTAWPKALFLHCF